MVIQRKILRTGRLDLRPRPRPGTPRRRFVPIAERFEQRQLLSVSPALMEPAGAALELEVAPPTLPRRPALPGFERLDPELLNLYGAAQGGRSSQAIASASSGLTPMAFDAAGRVGVTVTTSDADRLGRELEGLGFQVVASLPALHLIEGFLPIGNLPAAAALANAGLMGIVASYRPQTSGGAVTSQGDFVMEADRVRNTAPGFDGSGVRVGIISDSFNRRGGYAADVASGDLPPDVRIVLEGPAGTSDEGRAMAQIIHDLAPGATLGFASAFTNATQTAFAQIVRDLADPSIFGASVITDDVFFNEEPIFQDGVIAQAIDEVVATRNVAYFASAGNVASQAWETTSPNFGRFDPQFNDVFLDFNPGAATDTRQRINLNPGQAAVMTLQWDDPFFTTSGVRTDLDIFVLDVAANQFVAASFRDNIALGLPSEIVGFINQTGSPRAYDVFIVKFAGPDPGRVKWVNYGANSFGNLPFIEYATNSSTITPHAAAAGMAVGAAPYFNQRSPEPFTSIGPTTILFAPNGARLAAPEVRQTPDVTATDGVDTTFFGQDVDGSGFPNFFGTSAAAPHAAAVAALVRQAEPGLTGVQVQDRLKATAIDLGPAGFDVVTGFGLIDAFTAVFGPPVPASVPVADGFESGALSIDWETNRFGSGRTRVTGAFGPDSGAFHLTMDSSVQGLFGLNEAILRIDATTAEGDVFLAFRQREFNDFDDPMPATFTGRVAADGVALSVDGNTWYRIVSLTGTNSRNVYQGFRFNLSEIAAANGLTLGPDTRVKFQQFDLGVIPNGGFAFDDVRVFAPVRLDDFVVNPLLLERPEQRSVVRSLALDVRGAIASAPVAAFSLVRQQDGQAFAVAVDSIAPLSDGRTRILLGLVGAGLEGGSLPDGDYTLTIDGGQIIDSNGLALDADGDGKPGGVARRSFFRFFGDADGDRDVDASDFLVFRQAITTGDAARFSFLDFDANGAFDAVDTGAFYARRGRIL